MLARPFLVAKVRGERWFGDGGELNRYWLGNTESDGDVKIDGLTEIRAAQAIAKAYRDQRLIQNAQVWVLKINGKAIYGSNHWTRAEDGDLRYTTTKSAFNVISMSWPKGGQLTIPGDLPVSATSAIRILGGNGKPLPWQRSAGQIVVTLPPVPPPPTAGYPVVFAITAQ